MKIKLLIATVLVFALNFGFNLSAGATGTLPFNPSLSGAAGSSPGLQPASVWSNPVVIYSEAWDDPLYFDINDDGTRLVALIPYSGASETTRRIVVSELSGGTWQEPVVIAQNGAYSDALVQVLPQRTHPLISGDGSTIAYVGYTGVTYGVYIVDRQGDNTWGAPLLVNTGQENTHYWISLSQDGNTLTMSDYPFWGTQQVYVATRQAGIWGAPVLIGPGGDASLSEDGSRLVFVSNARLAFTERVNGLWTSPVQLTSNNNSDFSVEYPQMSGDGLSIFYWLVTLVPENSALIRTEQNLYLMRRAGAGWSQPQQVNAKPVLPSHVTEGPAAADRHATRLMYTFPITSTDGDHTYISSSHLQTSEWVDNFWQESRLVEVNGFGNYNKWPRLTPDGKTLIFDGGIRYTQTGAVYNALWQMTTNAAPPLPASTTAVIPPSGGSLFSEIDQTHYEFATGTFTGTVQFTHTYIPNPAPPPASKAGIGHSFSISAVYSDIGQPAQPAIPVTVTIEYGPTGNGNSIPGTLCLWWMDVNGWKPLDSVDDPVTGRLTAHINHFSDFAVFGDTRQIFLPIILKQ
jgi:hypothetical protein